ncbi:MAG: hypothetical protein M3P49_14615 [Actinomycetota bacterium]|nr:hypothetical protein [Actinomycetota bacterium]
MEGLNTEEFYPVATLGFRAWRYHHRDGGILTSTFPAVAHPGSYKGDERPFGTWEGYFVWDLDGVNEASCPLRSYGGDATAPHGGKPSPVEGCTCGIYSHSKRLGEHRTFIPKVHPNTSSSYGVVSGVVANWGVVDHWPYGSKAQKAYVLGLFEPWPYDEQHIPWAMPILRQLAEKHSIPLLRYDSLFTAEEAERYAHERGIALAREVL